MCSGCSSIQSICWGGGGVTLALRNLPSCSNLLLCGANVLVTTNQNYSHRSIISLIKIVGITLVEN